MTLKSVKILIADDDEAIVDATSMMLEAAGYDVNFTLNGAEVAQLIIENKPDLLLLDIWMSGVDGRDVCRLIKAGQLTSTIPVLMISASRDVKDSAMKSGADDFLAKPFEMNELLEKVAKLTTESNQATASERIFQ